MNAGLNIFDKESVILFSRKENELTLFSNELSKLITAFDNEIRAFNSAIQIQIDRQTIPFELMYPNNGGISCGLRKYILGESHISFLINWIDIHAGRFQIELITSKGVLYNLTTSSTLKFLKSNWWYERIQGGLTMDAAWNLARKDIQSSFAIEDAMIERTFIEAVIREVFA